MKIFRQLYLRSWRGLALAASLTLIAYALYFHRLANLLSGYAQPEVNAYASAGNWHAIVSNPVNAPYKALVWLLGPALHHGVFVTRVVAAAYGMLAGLLFFVAVRAWCTYRTAFLATVMFITSAGLLHFARFGSAAILQMGVLLLLDLALWYRRLRKHRTLISYGIVVCTAFLWYVPGMFWFELAGLLALGTTVRHQLRRTKTVHLAGLLVTFLACLAPLLKACAGQPKLLLRVAGLPQNLHTLSGFGGRLWNIVTALIAHSNGNPLFWVGHAPLLDATEAILVLLGAFYILRGTRPRRIFLLGSLTAGVILTAFGGSVTFACLVPVLYLFVAIGLDALLGDWLSVFPRNPVARPTGVGIICLMILFSVLYQTRSYYVAWPHEPAARAVFSLPQTR